jgi:hypothetical protein
VLVVILEALTRITDGIEENGSAALALKALDLIENKVPMHSRLGEHANRRAKGEQANPSSLRCIRDELDEGSPHLFDGIASHGARVVHDQVDGNLRAR